MLTSTSWVILWSDVKNPDKFFDIAFRSARQTLQQVTAKKAHLGTESGEEISRSLCSERATNIRSEDERRLREEAERLRWMLETKERRNLVQQHMSNLKRQRALEAERLEMEREEKATLSVIREENR